MISEEKTSGIFRKIEFDLALAREKYRSELSREGIHFFFRCNGIRLSLIVRRSATVRKINVKLTASAEDKRYQGGSYFSK